MDMFNNNNESENILPSLSQQSSFDMDIQDSQCLNLEDFDLYDINEFIVLKNPGLCQSMQNKINFPETNQQVNCEINKKDELVSFFQVPENSFSTTKILSTISTEESFAFFNNNQNNLSTSDLQCLEMLSLDNSNTLQGYEVNDISSILPEIHFQTVNLQEYFGDKSFNNVMTQNNAVSDHESKKELINPKVKGRPRSMKKGSPANEASKKHRIKMREIELSLEPAIVELKKTCDDLKLTHLNMKRKLKFFKRAMNIWKKKNKSLQ